MIHCRFVVIDPSALAANLERGTDGLWWPRTRSRVDYPDEGNAFCFQVEDHSFWFQHRNACILAVMSRYPPGGTLFDIGGGNGFVARALVMPGSHRWSWSPVRLAPATHNRAASSPLSVRRWTMRGSPRGRCRRRRPTVDLDAIRRELKPPSGPAIRALIAVLSLEQRWRAGRSRPDRRQLPARGAAAWRVT